MLNWEEKKEKQFQWQQQVLMEMQLIICFPSQEFAFYSKGHFEETVLTEVIDNIPEIVDEPETFQEAFHHPDEVQREKWRAAIYKEFRDMLKITVWQNPRSPITGDASSGYSLSRGMEPAETK